MIIPGEKFNFKRLKKSEIIWLYDHYCSHGHRFTAHPHCYFKERPEDGPLVERIGFLDIEATNLKADFGYCLSYCIKELDGDILEFLITPADIKKYRFDLRLMEQLIKDIRKFDRIVVYWGKDYRYDIPFIRTRALHHGIEFPIYKDLIVNDLFDIVKKKLRLHRNRLETACEFLDIPAKGHRLSPNVWQKAQAGDKESLEWILEHNREDVVSTELLWKKLKEFTRHPNTSI